MYEAKILANLRPFGAKWVNPFIAMSGVLGNIGAGEEMQTLINEGKVEKMTQTLGPDNFGRYIEAPLYRATPDYTMSNRGNTFLHEVK